MLLSFRTWRKPHCTKKRDAFYFGAAKIDKLFEYQMNLTVFLLLFYKTGVYVPFKCLVEVVQILPFDCKWKIHAQAAMALYVKATQK